MSEINRHDDIRELLPLYALGQLEDRDQVRVERALATDSDLRAELGSYERVAARLGDGIPQLNAPPAIREHVLASVRASAAHRAGGTIEDVADAAESVRSASSPARDRARRRWFTAPAFTGALAAACLILAVVAVDLGRDLDAAEQRADRLARANTGAPGGAPPGFEDARPYTVAMEKAFEGASGSLIRLTNDTWILMINDVPAPAAGNSWQVWTANSAGLIENVAQWHTGDDHVLVLDNPDIVEVMVSYEPTTRPVPTPSSKPVADVKV